MTFPHHKEKQLGCVAWSEINIKANGGTELLGRELEKRIPADLQDQFQIIPSRMRDLDETKIRIYWAHDLPGDPEAEQALANQGWSRFHRVVFVSNWQMQAFIARYNIPWSRCLVMPNAINPIPVHEKPKGKVRIIYSSTPHRGLGLVYPAFKKLQEKHGDTVELVVYSSFKLYGWAERDKEHEGLFNILKEDPSVEYHDDGSNDDVRNAIQTCHVFAYPSVWMETSCLCLLEAMSGGLLCIHPNYGALYETAAAWTMMYQFHEDPNSHATQHFACLESAVSAIKADPVRIAGRMGNQKSYTDSFFSWDLRAPQWEGLMRGLVNEPRPIQRAEACFQYRA